MSLNRIGIGQPQPPAGVNRPVEIAETRTHRIHQAGCQLGRETVDNVQGLETAPIRLKDSAVI